MFTGIIETVGYVDRIEKNDRDARMCFSCADLDMSTVCVGDSIAVNGVCLTVVEMQSQNFSADVSAESLSLTTLGSLESGSAINLEQALTPKTHMGGHIVSGHIDGVGRVVSLINDGLSVRIEIRVPAELAKYVSRKGSICVDGVSLTVNSVSDTLVCVNIVPHTQQQTIISKYVEGSEVNVEVDLIARYLERLLTADVESDLPSSITPELLSRCGFR